MDPSKSPTRDPLIDDVRETRDRLIRQHGGLRGWAAYLQEQQQKHLQKPHRQSKSSNGGSE